MLALVALAASGPHPEGPLLPGERQCSAINAHPITGALDANGRPRWSRFYSVKNVCVAPRPDACGTRLEVGFDDGKAGDFDPLHALRQWMDLFESGCGGSPLEGVRKESTGLAFTVQHINAYNEESIQHQAAALLAMFGDAGEDKEMQKRLARVTSVVLPQYASREQLQGEMQWLTGMLGVVLPKCVSNKCKEGKRELHACAELAEPVCFDELIVHRQVRGLARPARPAKTMLACPAIQLPPTLSPTTQTLALAVGGTMEQANGGQVEREPRQATAGGRRRAEQATLRRCERRAPLPVASRLHLAPANVSFAQREADSHAGSEARRAWLRQLGRDYWSDKIIGEAQPTLGPGVVGAEGRGPARAGAAPLVH